MRVVSRRRWVRLVCSFGRRDGPSMKSTMLLVDKDSPDSLNSGHPYPLSPFSGSFANVAHAFLMYAETAVS